MRLSISKIKNLYLVGDFVKNAIDLARMEGAVSAALETAGQRPDASDVRRKATPGLQMNSRPPRKR